MPSDICTKQEINRGKVLRRLILVTDVIASVSCYLFAVMLQTIAHILNHFSLRAVKDANINASSVS